MQVTMRSMQSDATTASNSMKKLGDTIAKEYGVAVKVSVDNTLSAKNALRDTSREADRSAKAYKILADEYTHLSSRIGKTADEQEVLNAVFRLGANATEQQKQEVAQMVNSYQRLRNESLKVQGSFRGMRGQTQNLGYQLQDVAVQAQMGTNAFTILSQQGSQFAAGFGPTGAIVGAGIAVAGMLGSLLVPNLKNTSGKVKELTDELKELARVSGLTGEMAEFMISKEYEKQLSLEKSSAALRKEIDNYNTGAKTYKDYIAQQEAIRLATRAVASGSIERIKTEAEWLEMQRKSATSLKEKISEYQNQRIQINKSIEAQELYRLAIGRSTDAEKSNKELVKSAKDKADAIGLTTSEILEQEKAEKLALLTKQRAGDEDKKSLANSYDAQIQQARMVELSQALAEETSERLKNQAEVNKQNKKELDLGAKLVQSAKDRADAIGLTNSELLEKQKAEQLALLTTNGYNDVERESLANSYDILIANAREIELLQALSEEVSATADARDEANKVAQEELALISRRNAVLAGLDIGDTSQLDAKYKAEQKLLEGNNKALNKLQQDYERDKLKITGTAWQKYMLDLEDQIQSTDELLVASVDRFKQGFGEAFTDALFESQNFGEGLKNLFVDVTKNMVAFFAEWAAQEATLWVLRKFIDTSTQKSAATTMTANAQATALQAGIAAFASTAAIPIIGPALAPGAMAAALAVTEPAAAAISGIAFAGAFDKGGVIPQDAFGIVSEYGDELVNGVLVKGRQGGTRVTGREDTARMMGGNSTSNITINSSGNASPEAIARALTRAMRKPNKQLDTSVYESMNRGRNNRGKRFA